jgi:lipopolysaccharide assembly protein A
MPGRRVARFPIDGASTAHARFHGDKGGIVRILQAILFLAFLGAVGLFAVQNTRTITVDFWKWELTGPVAIVIVAVYLLGMLSGWTVVAFVRRSLRKVGEQPRQ